MRNLLIVLVLFSVRYTGFADTRLIKDLDIRDVWQYNFNISHWLEQGNLRVGESLYGEEPVRIVSLAEAMAGSDWIQPAYGSKNYVRPVIATFRVTTDADVFIAHDDAIAVKPSWLKAYRKTDWDMKAENGDTFTFYCRRYRSGETVELGNNGSTEHSMYLIAVRPAAEWPARPEIEGRVFDVRDCGAVGDAKTINTKAIQQAIDRCSAAGGGTVLVRDGVYVTGTLRMRDYVTLFVEAGAILRGSADRSDYPEMVCSLPSFRAGEHYQLLYAENNRSVAITGGGIIDGYSLFEGYPWKGRNNEHERPRIIRMIRCKDVSLKNITFVRSPNWTQYYEGCENLTAENITIRCYTGTNNQDGIDLSGCRNVSLKNFNVSCGDDVICVKAMSMLPGENIRVDGVRSRYANCNIVKIGTETHSVVRNMYVTNVEGIARYCVAIESVDGAVVEDITYENVTLFNCAAPFVVRLGDRGRTFEGGPEKAPVGAIRNITLRNIRNTDIGYVETKGGPGIGAPVGGIPGHPIENLTIENCDLMFYGTVHDPAFVYRDVPENIGKYPEFNIYGICPAYGIYFRHVEGLKCKNIKIRLKNYDIRPAIVLDQVKDYSLENIDYEKFSRTVPSGIWHKQDGELVLPLP